MSLTYSDAVGMVRKRRVPGPHQTTFNVDRWCGALDSADDEVLLLRDSGLIAHEALTKLRQTSQALLNLPAKKKWGLAGLVACANLAGAELLRRLRAHQIASDRTYFDASDIVSTRPTFGDSQAESFDERMMGLVDSLVYPIQHFVRSDASSPFQEDVDWDWATITRNANQYCLAYGLLQKAIYQRAYLTGIAFSGVPVLQYEYFVDHILNPTFLEALLQAAYALPATLPYSGDLDAILQDDLRLLPLPHYQSVLARTVPASKTFSILSEQVDFEEENYWIRSTHETGSFFDGPSQWIRY